MTYPSNPYFRRNATELCANFALDFKVAAILLNLYKRSLSGSLCVHPPTAIINLASGYLSLTAKNSEYFLTSSSKSHDSSVPVSEMDAKENTMCVYEEASIKSAVKGLQLSSWLKKLNKRNRSE